MALKAQGRRTQSLFVVPPRLLRFCGTGARARLLTALRLRFGLGRRGLLGVSACDQDDRG
jgi:hypothetical protein